ncbi:hypothetical protein PL145_01860 [Dickeya fangzhongdai]|nr:hypothetical protein [Dickeya fangzhongdai]WKV51045.1 hypothetical protein PL145_01860 [Dickeya fangzhongdai]
MSLRVSPVVLSSGSLVMNIMSRADSISSQVTTASDIVTNQRQIETTVQIRDGQTLLIGGLLDDRSSSNDSSVPILSSIPLIGRLFTSSSDSTDRRSLFVMLRANIIHRM